MSEVGLTTPVAEAKSLAQAAPAAGHLATPAQKAKPWRRSPTKAGIGPGTCLVFLLALVGVPALYWSGALQIETVTKLGRFLAFAIVALSLDLLWGYTGILSFCQALFFGMGGYAMGMYLAMHGPLDPQDNPTIPRCLYVVSSQVHGMTLPWFWKPFHYLAAALPLGLLIPGLFALAIGYLCFVSRVRGVYFSILTLAISMAAWLVFNMNNVLLCGTNGLTNFDTLAGFDLRSPKVILGLFIIALLALGGVYILCVWVTNSRLGRVLIAIRDNETRLRFSGYKPHHFKVFVFVLAAMIAGLGGMLYAPQNGIFTPQDLTTDASTLVVAWVAVGGRGRLKGAVIGALLVNLMYSYLTSAAPEFWRFTLGGLYIGAAIFFTTGMINIRGGLFVTWLFAAPPVGTYLIRSLFSSDGPFRGLLVLPSDWTLSAAHPLLYYTYWVAWAATGAFLFWLLVDEERLNRPLRNLGRALLMQTDGDENGDGAAFEAAVNRSAAPNGDSQASRSADLQHRLSRIASIKRARETVAPEGSLLKVNDVKVLFDGFKALDIDSFAVDPFELRVIIGPNGAGKTTLCDVISGKTRPATGSVTFANTVIAGPRVIGAPWGFRHFGLVGFFAGWIWAKCRSDSREVEIARRGVGRKFQTPTVFNSLTVYENMELALPGRQELYRCFVNSARAEEREKIKSILRRVRLEEHADKQVQYLSHGQRQWLEISMLILASPMLLLVDEPAAGLTDEETVLTAELLLELQDEHSIIVIEHDMEFVRLLGSRVTVLNEGQIMADGTLEQVQKDPKVIEAYLGR